jgi:hypothetical protein
MNKSKTGSLGLNDQEEDALVAFMQTLTDGYSRSARLWNGRFWRKAVVGQTLNDGYGCKAAFTANRAF